jgi:NAD(P)-dependent dehydrogenase (short-subunit alcohol dehydrogenase family)
LVTGAARGIGRVISRTLAEAGASVALADRDDAVAGVAEALQAEGHRALPLVFDVSSGEAVKGGVARAQDELGGVDILVSNAGIVDHIAPLVRMQPERWDHEIAVNLGGAFHLLQAVLPGMVERGWGRIVLISSMAASGGLHRQAGYAASKAGLIALAKTVALEHAEHGISCNAVLPGLIGTENVASMPAALREAAIVSTPARRLGRMEEVAQLVAYLVSDLAGFVNGAEIRIDGGASLNTMTLGSVKELRARAASPRGEGGPP